MMKLIRAGALALATLLLAVPLAARAACPTAPTYGTLSGQDAATTTRTLQIFSNAGAYMATPLMHVWDGSTFRALSPDASCNLNVNVQAGTVTANAGTNLNTSLLALETGGNLATIATNTGNITPAYAATQSPSFALPTGATYTTNTAISDSATVPTTGGFTISNACRTSGGTGVITAVAITSSNDPSLLLQGEVWIFDSAVTAINNNASFSISDSDILKLVPGGVIPFTLATTNAGSGTNSYFTQTNLNVPYTCNGTANLRFLVKAKNAYIWATGETLQFRMVATALN